MLQFLYLQKPNGWYAHYINRSGGTVLIGPFLTPRAAGQAYLVERFS